jgi:glycosyltransferase involved in cell wall biosynthesis
MKKVFFVLSSLRAGGAERVFWLLSQYFDKSKFEVTIVLLDSSNPFYSSDLPGVRVLDLRSVKSSRSIFKLLKLIRKERPFAVYSTAPHINILVAVVSFFYRSGVFIARESCIPNEMVRYISFRGKVADKLIKHLYHRFSHVVCQSDEMRSSLMGKYGLRSSRLVVIPNPVIETGTINDRLVDGVKKVIVVARLVKEKGHRRLLDIFSQLPDNYQLSIVGSGPLRDELQVQVREQRLEARVKFLGQVKQVTNLIAEHDALVLSSYTEGFPNAIIESLSVGTPVVTFEVGGVSGIIRSGFNGFIIPQDDVDSFKEAVLETCTHEWDKSAIKDDAQRRYGVTSIARKYEQLMLDAS